MCQTMGVIDSVDHNAGVYACSILMLEEVPAGSTDLAIILARVLSKLKHVTTKKFASSRLQLVTQTQMHLFSARWCSVNNGQNIDSRHQKLADLCTIANAPTKPDNLKMAMQADIELHHK